MIKEFNGIWEGLDKIENNKIRAICFMNNLNTFHDHIWSYAGKHGISSKGNDTVTSTVLNLTSEKLRNEINNVMDALCKLMKNEL